MSRVDPKKFCYWRSKVVAHNSNECKNLAWEVVPQTLVTAQVAYPLVPCHVHGEHTNLQEARSVGWGNMGDSVMVKVGRRLPLPVKGQMQQDQRDGNHQHVPTSHLQGS